MAKNHKLKEAILEKMGLSAAQAVLMSHKKMVAKKGPPRPELVVDIAGTTQTPKGPVPTKDISQVFKDALF